MSTGTTVVGARVFDGREVQAETSVRFAGGLVTACAARDVTRDGDEVVDGTGRTLLPGLIDAHTHLLPGAPQQACTFGVTTELDMFSQPDLVRRCKGETAVRHEVADVRSSGIGATAPGGHPSMMYAPFPTVTGPDDADGFVADRIAEGSDYLKIIYEPGDGRLVTLPSLDFATVRALAQAAHDRGMVVVVHATSVAAFAGVVGSGVDILTHVPVDALLDDELVGRIAAAGIALAPTLATIENALGEDGGRQLADDPALSPFLGPRWRQNLARSASGWHGQDLPAWPTAPRNVARLAAAGVPVLAGTDTPNPGTVHGASLHRELELLVGAGLTPQLALQAATSAPARVFGLIGVALRTLSPGAK